MIKPKTRPKVKLTGKDGNAFNLMGIVSKALRKAGADKEYIEQFHKDAMSGDYPNLLRICMEYTEVS
jgi:hypothetical protein